MHAVGSALMLLVAAPGEPRFCLKYMILFPPKAIHKLCKLSAFYCSSRLSWTLPKIRVPIGRWMMLKQGSFSFGMRILD